MGEDAMRQVAEEWGDLPGNAFKVLCIMALSVLDSDKRPVYWGGWERLAVVALGRRDWPADGDMRPAAVRAREAGRQAVKQAVAQLVQAGVITVEKHGRKGMNAEYALAYRYGNRTRFGRETLPNGVGKPYGMGYGITTPEDASETQEDTRGDATSSESVNRTASVASLAQARARIDAERKGTL